MTEDNPLIFYYDDFKYNLFIPFKLSLLSELNSIGSLLQPILDLFSWPILGIILLSSLLTKSRENS